MAQAVITGTGLFTPSASISNEELVASFNAYVDQFNAENTKAISAGTLAPLAKSDESFIQKASGIKSRYVMDKANVLNSDIMQPIFEKREDHELSLQAEMAIKAAEQALNRANCTVKDIDMVIVACSNMQRAYPAIAIEVQQALGIQGFAFDMNVACSSATFAIQAAAAAIHNQNANGVLIINPEICSAHLNFRDRDSHFIFGDACTAMVVQRDTLAKSPHPFDIIDARLKTEFSSNIRNNFGFLSKAETLGHPEKLFSADQLFVQQGRKVFKEVVPMVVNMIQHHLSTNKINPAKLKRLWLHQANANMNRLIAEKVLGFMPDEALAPTILDQYANTSSPGCVIAFHQFHEDLSPGDLGILCSFGAGYSVGNIILRKRESQ